MRHIKSTLEATVNSNQHLKPNGKTTNHLYTDDFFAEQVIKPNVEMLHQLDSAMAGLSSDRHALGLEGRCPKHQAYMDWMSHQEEAVEQGISLFEWAVLSASRARRTKCECHGDADFSVNLISAKRLKKANTKVKIDGEVCIVTYYSTDILVVSQKSVLVNLTVNTPTTRNRINDYCEIMGLNLGVYQKGKPYLRLLNRQDPSKCKSVPFPSHGVIIVTR